MILLDFAGRTRLKIWATANLQDAEEDPDLAATFSDPDYKAKVERLITLKIEAFDWNCPQHITPRFTEAEIAEDICKFLPPEMKPCGECD